MNVKQAVESLGGPAAVAEVLKTHRNTVTNWTTKGYVSGAMTMAFFDLCKKYKLDIKLTDIVRKK